MQLPDECQAWVEQMEQGSEDDRRILENLRGDPCIDDTTAGEFCSQLTDAGPPASAQKALEQAHDIVRENPDRFLCQGLEIPAGTFTTLLRLEDVDALRYRIPPEVLVRVGLTDAEIIAGTPDEDLRLITDDYKGPVRLGNPLGLVWSADYAVAEPLLDRSGQLSDRLGLEMDAGEARAVICVYDRISTGRTLHVPRALDALVNPAFEPNCDCSAESGWTRPRTPRQKGLPEGVHRSCSVVPKQWELRSIV